MRQIGRHVCAPASILAAVVAAALPAPDAGPATRGVPPASGRVPWHERDDGAPPPPAAPAQASPETGEAAGVGELPPLPSTSPAPSRARDVVAEAPAPLVASGPRPPATETEAPVSWGAASSQEAEPWDWGPGWAARHATPAGATVVVRRPGPIGRAFGALGQRLARLGLARVTTYVPAESLGPGPPPRPLASPQRDDGARPWWLPPPPSWGRRR